MTSDTRAREGKLATAERVNQAAELMRTGGYQRGQTDKLLAQEWGLSESRVRDLTAEAWRRVCAEAEDADKARPTIAGMLMTNLAKADVAEKYQDVARLADVWSRVVGARAPEKHEDVTPEKARPLAEQIAIAESVVAALKSQGTR